MERRRDQRIQKEGVAFCLGNPSHAVTVGTILCPVCETLVAGAILGTYQIHSMLGAGRSGKAYLAIHLRLGQQAVIKLFPPNPASFMLWESARREVRAIASLRHDTVLPTFSCNYWRPEGFESPLTIDETFLTSKRIYLLTLCQYIPGSLSHFVAEIERNEFTHGGTGGNTARQKLLRLTSVIGQIGMALSTIHTSRFVHGALVPGNILIDAQDHLWLADFGLARLSPPSSPYLAPELSPIVQSCMHTGDLTPFWNACSPASDQYMFAVLCNQILKRLFHERAYTHILPVLRQALQQQVSRRFDSIATFTDALVFQLESLPGIGDAQPAPQNRRSSWPAGLSAPQRPARIPSNPVPASSSPSLAQMSMQDWEVQGDNAFKKHDYEKAVYAYRKALALDAGRASLWLALGDALFALENYTEALKMYGQAISLNPNDPVAWFNRGTVFEILGRREDAAACYERAEQLKAE
ncbi:MAG: tetratricopeptide repeat protein [Ktedonobacteraceae bacterium]|nr:tetratricopeptide repeat protein [Ktedonobacteraceae bacterium]